MVFRTEVNTTDHAEETDTVWEASTNIVPL